MFGLAVFIGDLAVQHGGKPVDELALAAAAAGADGIMLEVHDAPGDALSDGPQALSPEAFATLVGKMRKIAGIAAGAGSRESGEKETS